MKSDRWWSSCGIVFSAMMLASCTQGQIQQAMGNSTQDMISGPCPPAGGPLSAAPEFCLYVTEMHVVNHDTEADVSATLTNRTGRRVYLVLSFPTPQRPYLTDSTGTRWEMIGNTGIPVRDGVNSLALEPNVDSQIAFRFRRSGQGSGELIFSLRGEIGVLKTDSRGGVIANQLPQYIRGFNFSNLRQGQPPQGALNRRIPSVAPGQPDSQSVQITAQAVQARP